MTVSDIFLLILMGAASILCLCLVFFLNKITRSVTLIQKDLSGLAVQIQPVIGNITDMTEKLNIVTEDLRQPISDAVDLIGEVKERVDIIFNLEEKLRHGIGTNLSGMISGVKTFWSSYKRNGHSSVLKRIFARI